MTVNPEKETDQHVNKFGADLASILMIRGRDVLGCHGKLKGVTYYLKSRPQRLFYLEDDQGVTVFFEDGSSVTVDKKSLGVVPIPKMKSN